MHHPAPLLLTPEELKKATGKTRVTAQAVELVRRGIPFQFAGRAVKVARDVAAAHDLLPEASQNAGFDWSKVR